MSGTDHLPTRTLRRDGPDVSVICLGTWGLGGGLVAIEEKQAIENCEAGRWRLSEQDLAEIEGQLEGLAAGA
jgi:hypothetical protein